MLRIKSLDSFDAQLQQVFYKRIIMNELRMCEDRRTASLPDQSDDLFRLQTIMGYISRLPLFQNRIKNRFHIRKEHLIHEYPRQMRTADCLAHPCDLKNLGFGNTIPQRL